MSAPCDQSSDSVAKAVVDADEMELACLGSSGIQILADMVCGAAAPDDKWHTRRLSSVHDSECPTTGAYASLSSDDTEPANDHTRLTCTPKVEKKCLGVSHRGKLQVHSQTEEKVKL